MMELKKKRGLYNMYLMHVYDIFEEDDRMGDTGFGKTKAG